jgi:preprotein translocase subunit SecG
MAPFEAIGSIAVRSIVMYITVVINVVSMISLIVGVLLHSGQGGGLSDMFGGSSGAALGSAAAERNLNRITTVLATIWLFTLIALSFLLT